MNTIHLQASRVIPLPGPPGGRLKNVTAQISHFILDTAKRIFYVEIDIILKILIKS
jgi:hypothetical protein